MVRSTAQKVNPIETLGDTVYVRKNIRSVNEMNGEYKFIGFEYDEEVMSLSDYLNLKQQEQLDLIEQQVDLTYQQCKGV